MSMKVFISIVFLAIIAIIIGLILLLQKQPKTKKTLENEENRLEIVGAQDTNIPSDTPKPKISQIFNITKTGPDKPVDNIDNPLVPKMKIDTKKEYSALLKTSAGNITISFFTKKTPITVNNFVSLAKDDFYNATIFHRVIAGFMIQGGDPKGDGTGDPGYKFNDEKLEGSYTRGTVAMANSGPNTNGSQFFIMHQDAMTMPNKYVIFGKVTKGMDVVDTIATAEVTSNPQGEPSKPIEPVVIKSVKIIEE